MRIRSLLHIFLAAALLLVLLLSLANWQLTQRLDAVSARLDQTQASVRKISTLLILTHEYALHSEERAAQQWKESLAALTGQLNGDDSAATGPLAPHLDELRQQTAVMSAIFEKLEAASQSPETPLQVRRKRLLLDQMLTKVGGLSDSIEHLQQATRVEYEKVNRQHHRLSEATPWAVLVLLVVLSVLLRRWVLQPLARLQTSVRAVAKGDLTVRSASTANDELGELSRTFDAMAVDLVAELRKEVAERKAAEAEVRRLNRELEETVRLRTALLESSNKELEAFSYSVSHDLRAPLRHISGYVDLLNNRFREALPEKAGHYLNQITGSASQMGTLIDDLLQFSRTGRQELRQADLDMNAAVQEALAKLKADTKNRNISWTVAELPRVYGDYALLQQVWINLLDNAVKYTQYKDQATIEVGFTREPDQWEFFVRDNGVGFDMQYAHKLFGVFQRLHSPAQFEGTGIGLANVQRIVLKHGGRVRAEAQPEKGATFYFTLPRKSFAKGGPS